MDTSADLDWRGRWRLLMDQSNLLPHDIQAERALLSSLLQNVARVGEIADSKGLQEDWFYTPDHSAVWKNLRQMHKEGRPVELVTASSYFSERYREIGLLTPNIFGLMTELFTIVPTWTNCAYYIQILQECAAKRFGILEAMAAQKKLREAQSLQDVFNITSSAFTKCQEACAVKESLNVDHEEIMAFMDKMDRAVKGEATTSLMPFYLPTLDAEVGGAAPGELVTISGLTSTGKSLLSKKFVQDNVFNGGKKGAIFSVEMLHEQCLRRVVADLGGISLQSMRYGKFSQHEFNSFSRTMMRISEAPLSIYDIRRNSMTPESIEAEMRRLKKDKGLDVACLDYLQLLRVKKKKDNSSRRDQELSSVSSSMKQLAMELGIVIVLVAQANEAGGVFDSSQVESDSDWAFNMMPTTKMEGKIRRITGTDGVWISKAREGQRGRKIPLRMEGRFARISECEEQKQEAAF